MSVCGVCNKQFQDRKTVFRHMKLVHNKNSSQNTSGQCKYCGKTISTIDRLKLHEQEVHLKIRKFQCKSCDKFL